MGLKHEEKRVSSDESNPVQYERERPNGLVEFEPIAEVRNMGLKHEENGFPRIEAARGGTVLSHSGHPTRGCNLVGYGRERPDVLVEFEPVIVKYSCKNSCIFRWQILKDKRV